MKEQTKGYLKCCDDLIVALENLSSTNEKQLLSRFTLKVIISTIKDLKKGLLNETQRDTNREVIR